MHCGDVDIDVDVGSTFLGPALDDVAAAGAAGAGGGAAPTALMKKSTRLTLPPGVSARTDSAATRLKATSSG